MKDIKKLTGHFVVYGDYLTAKPFGNGHINDTFLVSYNQAGINVNYIIRKINKYVFKQPEIVVNNSVKISLHIKNKLEALGETEISRKTLTFVKTRDDKYYHIDQEQDYWCMVLFFEDAYTVDYVKTKEQAYNAAKAFGKFQKLIIDAKVADYEDSIPEFHHLPKRLAAFDDVLRTDPSGRLKNIRQELKLIDKNRAISEEFVELIKSNKLPVRISHNDTKINNVMIDSRTDEGLSVIDLDTVMPGIILNDFGDMVRTSTCPVAEDEKDISKVKVQIDVFEALTKGYLEELVDYVTETEINKLVFGAKLIVYEQAVRFITDYLAGDVYYSTSYEDHNLVRAKNQLALLESICQQESKMEGIVAKYVLKKV
ncbi:MAG: phosphotransferase [Bacteroidota bacterium]